MNNEQLIALLKNANAQRDTAELALAEYKREVYVAISAMYESALDMFDTADVMPGFITELAEAFDVHTAFTCPACKVLRPFEMGSGDCQTCENCCKCAETGDYCWPYNVSCVHERYSDTASACSVHGEDAHCWQMRCDNCNVVMRHETPQDGGEVIY